MRVCCTFELLVLLAATAAGAEAGIRVSGKVANETDAPLGSAKVVFHPQGFPGGVYAYTDPSGRYEAMVSAAGEYLVDVEAAGYFPLKGYPVTLSAGANDLDFRLNRLREFYQSVDVSAAPPPINIERTGTQETVTGAQIINVPYPTTNDLRNALRIIPGVVQDGRGGLHINGGADNQAMYTLNGFNITDPLTGRLESRLSVEAVQSVDVVSGALPAEQGKGSAGVVAIETRTGDDKFRTTATNFIPGVEYRKGGLLIGGWTPRVNFSGPIRRGRAWFSNAFDTQFNNTIVRELPKGQDQTTSWRVSNHLNTQVNITPGNILYTGFLVNIYTAPQWGLSVLDPRETTRDLRRRQWFFHAKDQLYLGRDVLVEVGYAANRTFGREIPQGHGFYQITPDGNRGNFFLDAIRKSSRDQILVNGFFPEFKLAGEHRVKAGLDLNRLAYWQDARRTGYETLSRDWLPRRRIEFGGSGRADISNYETSWFLQDSWKHRPNLVFEVGLRGDWDQLLNYWNVSPRLGFAWSPRGMEHTKISGGYGMIHDATPLRVFSRPQDQYSLTTYFTDDGQVYRGPAVTVFTINHPRLARPRQRVFNVGLEREWTAGVHTRLEYLRKRGRYGFTYVNRFTGQEYVPSELAGQFDNMNFDAIYALTNDRRDAYDSVQVTLRHVIRRQWEWMVSYTRSHARSNAVVDATIDDPVVTTFNTGPMPWDSPNRVISWGYLPTFWKKWAIAYMVEYRTGFPFSILNDEAAVVGGVNAQRFPIYFEPNLHLERRFEFRKQLWAFRMGCNNVTNHRNPTVVNNNASSDRYLQFYGGVDRSFNFRIRWLGKSPS
ncbi:MAG: TonB-dependent receptor [Bryobacteraceae bacterium]|nr:TonB-dependent receptor [Bryobacteraceae bacterium]